MNAISIIEKSRTVKIGKQPVVLVPLKLWQKLEDYLEDQEALSSKKYLRQIKTARKEIADEEIAPFINL